MSSSALTAEAIAIVSGSFLSGAMASLSVMAIPVFFDTTTQPSQLYHQWARMYHHGHQVLPGMAITTLALYVYTALSKRGTRRSRVAFAAAGLVTVSMLPFTWIFMVPTNNMLFRLEVQSESTVVGTISEAKDLVRTWAWLHLTRSVFPLVGAAIGLSATLNSRW